MNPNAVQEERGPRKKVRSRDTDKNSLLTESKDHHQEVSKKSASKSSTKPSKLEEGNLKEFHNV